jgi:hypothetical protein
MTYLGSRCMVCRDATKTETMRCGSCRGVSYCFKEHKKLARFFSRSSKMSESTPIVMLVPSRDLILVVKLGG